MRSCRGSVQFNCEALAPWQPGLFGLSEMVPCRRFCGCLTGRTHHDCLYISPSETECGEIFMRNHTAGSAGFLGCGLNCGADEKVKRWLGHRSPRAVEAADA